MERTFLVTTFHQSSDGCSRADEKKSLNFFSSFKVHKLVPFVLAEESSSHHVEWNEYYVKKRSSDLNIFLAPFCTLFCCTLAATWFLSPFSFFLHLWVFFLSQFEVSSITPYHYTTWEIHFIVVIKRVSHSLR